MYPYFLPMHYPQNPLTAFAQQSVENNFKPNLSVFISDFEESLGEPDIFNYFKKFGQIKDVKKFREKPSAIVSFYTESEAQRAIKEGNHSKILDKHIRVIKYSNTKEQQISNRYPNNNNNNNLNKSNKVPPLEVPSNSNIYVKMDKSVTIGELDDLILRLIRFTSHRFSVSTSFSLEGVDRVREEIQGSVRLGSNAVLTVDGKSATLLSQSEESRAADLNEVRAFLVNSHLRKGLEVTQEQIKTSNETPSKGNFLLLNFVAEEDQRRVKDGNIGHLVRDFRLNQDKTPFGLLYKEEEVQELSLVDKKVCNLIEVGPREKIASSKIKETERGESLGYGYVQLVDKDDADRCKNREIDLRGRAILKLFTQEREKQNSEEDNVLYLRGFGQEVTKAELENILKDYAKENNFGFLDLKTRGNTSFALAYFKSKSVAESVRGLLQENAKGLGPSLYVNLCQKSKASVAIYTKFLKEDVKEEQILEVFRSYGIVRCVLKSPKLRENSKYPHTQFAYLHFRKDGSSNLSDLIPGHGHGPKKNLNNPDIAALYHDGKVFFNTLQPKEKRANERKGRGQHRDHGFPFAAPFLPYQIYPMQRRYMPMPAGFNPSYFPMGYANHFQGQGHPSHSHNHPHPHNYYNTHHQHQYGNRGYKSQDQANPQASAVGEISNASAYQQRNFVPSAGQQLNFNNRGRGNQRGRGGPFRGSYNQGQGRGNYQNTRHQIQSDNSVQNTASTPAPQNNFTIEKLKDNLSEFLGYPKDEQRKILGGMLFPKVERFSTDHNRTPKITGMLVDFEVFEVNEILEFLENDTVLKERVAEAEELISKNDPSQTK